MVPVGESCAESRSLSVTSNIRSVVDESVCDGLTVPLRTPKNISLVYMVTAGRDVRIGRIEGGYRATAGPAHDYFHALVIFTRLGLFQDPLDLPYGSRNIILLDGIVASKPPEEFEEVVDVLVLSRPVVTPRGV